jgi:allantoin racemase
VVEICEAAAHAAMLIARSFSVVTTLQRSVPAIEDRLKLASLLDRCASVRASGMSTLEVDAAVRLAEALVGLGLATSKVGTYAPPGAKHIVGWPLGDRA